MMNLRYALVIVASVTLLGSCNGGSFVVATSPGGNAGTTVQVWVATNPIQCLGNAWEVDWLKNHQGDQASYPRDFEDQKPIIRSFFMKQGVASFDIDDHQWNQAVCLACSCPAGYTLYLRIDDSNVEKMKAFGFRLEDPETE